MANTQDGDNGKPAKRAHPKMGAGESLKNICKNFTIGQAILTDISYHIGRVSKHTVDGIKESVDTDTCKKIGKNVGAFCNHIENGWENPDKDTSEFGKIMGSCARSGTDLLTKTYKIAAGCLGKAYKQGRVATLIAIWKTENPTASKTKEQEAVNEIKKLFKA